MVSYRTYAREKKEKKQRKDSSDRSGEREREEERGERGERGGDTCTIKWMLVIGGRGDEKDWRKKKSDRSPQVPLL